MRKLLALALFLGVMVSLQAQEFEGIETGDKELSFYGMVYGQKYLTMGQIFVSGGYYINENLLLGVAPGITLMSGFGGTEATLSLQLFSTYNFFTDKTHFPYVKAMIYQNGFSSDEYSSFINKTSLQVGGGYKFFFSEHIAWDTSLTFGLGFTSPVTATVIFLTGLTFKL